MDGILTLEAFDLSLAEGVMLLTPFNADASDDNTVNFVEKYKEAYNEIPNQFAADGYDCIYAYKMALEASGCTPDMSAKDICEKLVQKFPTITFDGLTGEAMTWADTGEVSKSPKGMIIENGVYVGMD
jgi:branched-chain amino acid transport system substrate-binding protein